LRTKSQKTVTKATKSYKVVKVHIRKRLTIPIFVLICWKKMVLMIKGKQSQKRFENFLYHTNSVSL